MKSLFLSAVVGLSCFFFAANPAQAQWAWYSYGRPYVWTAPYYGYSYSYYPPAYSYYPSWSVPTTPVPTVSSPLPVQTAPQPAPASVAATNPPSVPQTYSANYGPGESGRFVYYSIDGLQICYDRTTGDFWYQDRSTRQWRAWPR
jgi:hypothetical protein